jgi:hypothetical protein
MSAVAVPATTALRSVDTPGALPFGDASVVPAAAVGTSAEVPQPRVVDVPDQLATLLPWAGLRRGSVVGVHGCTSLLFALLSTASKAGMWAAVVGRPDLGVLAAAEAGVAVQRLVLVPRPGAELAAVTAALLDGVDLVAVAGAHQLSSADRRRLTGRVRQRGAVLLPLDEWPGADVRLHGERVEWGGLGHGHGRLRSMRVTVRSRGRGAAARPRRADVLLVGDGTRTEQVQPRQLRVVGR